jgi:hypothetical protein
VFGVIVHQVDYMGYTFATTRVNLAGMGGLDPACCPCKSLGEKGHGVWTAVATIVLDEEVA